MKKSTLALVALLPVLLLGACSEESHEVIPGDKLEAGTFAIEEGTLSAKVVLGKLEVSLPVSGLEKGSVSGRVLLNVVALNGEFKTEASADFDIDAEDPVIRLALPQVPTFATAGEQANYVLNYDVRLPSGSIHGSRSLFMLLPKADLVVLMPTELVQGQETHARALLTDPRSGQPVPNQSITVTLTDEAGKSRTVDLVTDKFGMALLKLEPADMGTLTITAHAELEGSAEEVETDVQVVRDSKVLLTTDKPIYQPGQIMFLRLLALDQFDHHALAEKDVVFEINDSKGNKVFKVTGKTNAYGVASTQFQLGNQVLMGTYTLRAILGDVTTEKTVTVDKYVLPRFKVNATLDKPWYLAGQTVRGDVDAKYFFGKPISGGTVKVIPYKYEAQWVADTEIMGQTTAEGLYSFSYTLPDVLVGQPLEGGKALVMMEIIVTDTADHEEKVVRNILVAQKAMDITVIPESGTVVPGVENEFFIFVTDPTGEPMAASCDVTVSGTDESVESLAVQVPASGPGKLVWTPNETLSLTVTAQGAGGQSATGTFDFSVADKSAAVLLRTDKSIYKVGESIDIKAYMTGGFGHLFLDVVRKNQTVLTKTLEAEDGVATWTLDLDNGLAEDLVLNAYLLANNGQFIRDTRVVYVVPANDLTVTMASDKDEYRPGEKATVEFQVSDAEGKATQAALGVQVVDEAVFALSENKPGLLKLYFQLEEELSNPTYQVGAGNGWSFGQLFEQQAAAEPGSEEEVGVQDTATAAFAALGDVPLNQKELSSWDDALAQMKSAMAPVHESLKQGIRKQLELALGGENVNYDQACTWLQKYLGKPRFYDPWGSAYSFSMGGDQWWCQLTFTTKGPDEESGTVDDYSFTMDLWALMGENWRGGNQGMWAEDGDFAGPPMAGGGEPTNEEGNGPNPEPNEGGGDDGGTAAVKVRKWFPETLFVAPSLITDEQGKVQVEIPLADSITEWRMSTLASSAAGQLGSRTDGIVVFQDFFVDVDFPRFLTRGDEVQFPVVVYNYLTTAQTVDIQLEPAEWFEMQGDDSKQVSLQPGEVTAFYFPVKVTQVGLHALTVYGMGSTMSDAVQRTVEVKPDGKEVVQAWSARFANDGENQSTDHVSQQVNLPEETIPGSHNIVVQILPGLSSHIVGGMDSMLQLPGGCFEQTTSSAWPNVLAMRYLSLTGQVTPEIEMKAMEYINVGYQRILTFECADGGFNWWEGDNPGNSILSAVAIQMFTDTAEVYPTVDLAVRDRTADYLFTTQKSDGSWGEEAHLHAGNENLGAGSLRATCYIAWSLAYGGYAGEAGMSKAFTYINSKLPAETGAYTRAMCLNALIAGQPTSSLIGPMLQEFHDAAVVDDGVVYWTAGGDTLVNSYGNAADVEVTSLVALAMANKGSYPQDVNGAVEWLIRSKDPQGNWGYNTQATVLALKTFLKALTMSPADVTATVEIMLNGTSIAAKQFNDFNKDVLWQVELTEGLATDANLVEINYSGLGALSYQIISTHYVPWTGTEEPTGALSIDVEYSAATLHVDDTVTATVTITNNDPEAKGMVLVTLGVPPGFALMTQDLADLRAAGTISEYEVTGKQLILYFNEIKAGEPTVFQYGLVAEYPVKAETGGSEVSFYYNAEDKDKEGSQEIEILP